MAEYTYKDIIIDPTSEEAKNAIGKEVYFADTPASCLNAAKNNNKAYLGYLKKLDLGDEEQPFYVNEFVVSAPSSWTCIIVKKEEPKKYVPFETLDEFIESYKKSEERITYSNTRDYIASCGMWIRCKKGFDSNSEPFLSAVSEIYEDCVAIGRYQDPMTFKGLLEYCEFLDGTPCGKEVEE